jgi:adenylate cyclase
MGAHIKSLLSGEAFALEDFTLIGRSNEATIHLNENSISRQHATIRREGVHYWLVDLGSANGTYVNDMALTTTRVLRDGDRVQFGSNVFLFLQDDGAAHDGPSVGATTQVLRRNLVPVKTQPVTLLVGDLKGFTQLSAQVSADKLADLMREWYADCNMIMRKHGAMIDKFIGDCVFAYWPGIEPDIRNKAVEVARELRKTELESHSSTRIMLKQTQNITLDCRVGLHLGDVAMGAMGKGINTAVGDAVNVAFRIESLTRQLDCGVLASADFLKGWDAGSAFFESRGPQALKGVAQQLEVFSLKA